VGTISAGAIDLRIGGFDNTRTAGPVVYTFYDTAGATIASIPADNSADFKAYFGVSGAGGAFLLRAVFPVAGDASRIGSFEVQMTNSAGPATTGRVRF
jgi:hypothetical protein